jgi:eukaryotic-like serine/threonine-protein kinase
MTAHVIQRDRLGMLTKLGQGGHGVVYGAPNVTTKFAASMVYKEYKPQTSTYIDFTALAAMPALVEDSLSYAQAERLVSIAAWPCAVVEDAGTPKGFVMPAIPEQFFIPLTTVTGVSNTIAEFQHLLNHGSVLAARGIKIDDAQRYSLLREVASGLAFFHKHGVCVGDISPKNLLFSLSPAAAAYFIDCDAMRINRVSILSQVETPGWEAPVGEELATVGSDTYKLGLLALRLLAGDHDTTSLERLPSSTPDLLRQIITDTLKNQPHSRPLPEAWAYVLGHAIEYAQHQHKNAAAAPLTVAPRAPATAVVHSRPGAPTEHSRPPTDPSTPADSPPTVAKPNSWAAVAVAGVVVVLVVMIAISVALAKRKHGAPPQPAVGSTVTAQPAPPPPSVQTTTAPTERYVKTPWGTRCQVSADQIICDTCEPGLLLDTPRAANRHPPRV